GRPRFRRADIPMSGPPDEEARDLELDVGGHVFRGTAVSVGNPHFVILTQDVESVDVPLWGPRLERHPVFPQRANVEFVQVLGPSEVRMRVWERGSGITLACGTGACAAAVVAAASGRTGRRVVVHLDGGDLEVEWRDDDHVTLTGPVVEVFRGVYDPR
ncbi:MAG: diaminopimelate epimerase, partial [Clostridia bacterium]|nr:diaminopimelate epimerase [Clostridia bacterium]